VLISSQTRTDYHHAFFNNSIYYNPNPPIHSISRTSNKKYSGSFLNLLVLHSELKIVIVPPQAVKFGVAQKEAEKWVENQVVQHESDPEGGKPALQHMYHNLWR
jgi:hypothetical protein